MRFLLILLLASAPVFAGDDEKKDASIADHIQDFGRLANFIQFNHENWDIAYKTTRIWPIAGFYATTVAVELAFGALSFESAFSHAIAQTVVNGVTFPVSRNSKIDLHTQKFISDPVKVGAKRGIIASTIATVCHTALFHLSGLF